MIYLPSFPETLPPGLTDAIEGAGIPLVCVGGWWAVGAPNEPETDQERAWATQAEAIAKSYDPLPHVVAEKVAALADERWQKETGGFLFRPSGADRPYLFVSTRESMGPIMGAVLAVQSGVFPDPTMWKTAEPGAVFVPITAGDVLPMFKAFAAHVAAAFAEEAKKQAQVQAATDWKDVIPIKIDAAAGEAAPSVKP